NSSIKSSVEFVVGEFTDAISISDILVAESAYPTKEITEFSKSGYDILPRIATFYPSELISLPIYFEVYNTHQLGDSTFTVRQQVINSTTSEVLSDLT